MNVERNLRIVLEFNKSARGVQGAALASCIT